MEGVVTYPLLTGKIAELEMPLCESAYFNYSSRTQLHFASFMLLPAQAACRGDFVVLWLSVNIHTYLKLELLNSSACKHLC